MIQDPPRDRLKELVERHGPSLAEDPPRCGDLLADALGGSFEQYRREISLIETAAEEGVPRQLVAAGSSASVRVPALAARLARDRGLSQEAGRWAVDSWAYALGVTVPSRTGPRWRLALSLAGAAGLIASCFAPWGFGYKAFRIGVDILWTKGAKVHEPFWGSIGVVALALGVVAILGLVPRRGWATTLAGVLGLLVFIAFLITHSIRAHFPGRQLDYGSFLLLGGSILAMPAAFIGIRSAP
ncbi:MAG TPA: hypothetical protein VF660_03735 [Actinomycetota bacterium]|jgi:hypothetical protein